MGRPKDRKDVMIVYTVAVRYADGRTEKDAYKTLNLDTLRKRLVSDYGNDRSVCYVDIYRNAKYKEPYHIGVLWMNQDGHDGYGYTTDMNKGVAKMVNPHNGRVLTTGY